MRSLYILGLIVLLGACTPIGIAEKVVSVVAKPVLGLAVKDAKTTLAWVDREVKAERILPVQAEAAKRCPEADIALDALRARMSEGTAGVEGFRGLIYYGTLNRYGQGVQAEASRHLEQLARSCLPLIPAEKLMGVF
ncbi:hypothetical protein LCGC14_2848650 [marine sediment metagenome]|uniref:Lipoprotein n=1 Tax=marine sediment metagenome TaxID=412755 RepID=A0A0F8Y963_9ZZZZ